MQVQRMKKNCSTGDLRTSTITTRSYTLDRNTALEKKMEACQKEHIKFELKSGKNFVIELSTGAYETIKSEILNILQSEIMKDQFVTLPVQNGVENSGLTVDSCYKVFNKKLNGETGNMLKFTINMYHTTCKINVNGSRVDLFINNIFDKLCEKLTKDHGEINILNKNIQTYLSQLRNCSSETIQKSIAQEKSKKEQLNNPNEELLCIEQTVNTEDEISSLETCMRGRKEHSQDEQANTDGNTNTASPDNCICPYCNKYVEEGIGCDRCDYWYHYQCENLSNKVGENELKQLDYICTLCNDDIMYERRNITECDPSSEDNNINININTGSTQDEQDETGHNDQIRTRIEPDPITISIDTDLPSRSNNIQNQMREKTDMEETDLKLIFTPNINERSEGSAKSKQRPVSGNETGPTITITENVKEKKTNESLVKKNQKGTKNKNDKEETIIAQKTRILNLENEIKHMKSVLDTVTRREETQQNAQAQQCTTNNIHGGPNSDTHNTYMYQQLQNQMKEMHLGE
ncbi:unnamed protein product [Mytilus edulis]|uniref:PHD-type domain-containing protein n=1 Tax=Mytilus edulis TaxID=6550 RepID=A0A8S3SPY9_MYTED|nr:unnamed protein product [Mytilus edulis]